MKTDANWTRRVLEGALAGLAATVPMTATMLLLHRCLPWRERYPLPPRLITEVLASRTHPGRHAPSEAISAAAVGAHFGYGALGGACYGLLTPRPERAAPAKGIGFGLAVWAGSYLGWLPAAEILPPATRQPARRNALMVASHVVWGATTGGLMYWLARRREAERDEENSD